MVEQDIQALNDRLFDNIDVAAIQLLVEGQSDRDIQDTQLWTRWIIMPGPESKRTLGLDPWYLQEGTATLQIFVPLGMMTGPGRDVRDEFHALFRNWRSADKALEITGLGNRTSTYTQGDQEFHLINAMVFWRSRRRP